ncbi:GSCFA family protein [Algoriphagus ratkowskyi]|nr:GSCFA family protein [Algoriphagus ratkowskyi]
MGSCFAQTIGQKLVDHKFNCLVNPFGTIFNPYSLVKLLEGALLRDHFEEAEIIERDGLFFHYSSHSDLVADSKEALVQKLLAQRNLVQEYLESGTHLILTLGTAWVYELEDSGETVANCHKQAASKFTKRLLTLEEMKDKLWLLFDNLSRVCPGLNIILTVSPVRHIKDGIPENQLSKSLLRVLCHELEKGNSRVSYFPAYEILIDELRDYRFYAKDLIHPSQEAENYIWEKWQASNFSIETQQKTTLIQKIIQELAHRPLNPKSEANLKFLNNLLQKLERLNGEFDFSKEIKRIKSLNPPRV